MGKEVYWDFTSFISTEIHSESVILFAKGSPPTPQAYMLFQLSIFLVTMLLPKKPIRGANVENLRRFITIYNPQIYTDKY